MINTDGQLNDSLLGFNLFAYCENNPVNKVDPFGNKPNLDWFRNKANDVEKWFDQLINRSKETLKNIKDDFNKLSFDNEDEDTVLSSNYFSFYKKRLVIRTNLKRSGSFCIIFLSRYSVDDENVKSVLDHEYGHTIQLKRVGVINYTFFIGIPSALSGNLNNRDYYSMPWERSADFFGHVERDYDYLPYSENISILYLTVLEAFRPRGYFDIGGILLP